MILFLIYLLNNSLIKKLCKKQTDDNVFAASGSFLHLHFVTSFGGNCYPKSPSMTKESPPPSGAAVP